MLGLQLLVIKGIMESSRTSPFVCHMHLHPKMHSAIVSTLQGEIEALKNELSNVKALLNETVWENGNIQVAIPQKPQP